MHSFQLSFLESISGKKDRGKSELNKIQQLSLGSGYWQKGRWDSGFKGRGLDFSLSKSVYSRSDRFKCMGFNHFQIIQIY